MYFDGLSYRRTAENIGEYFGRSTNAVTVYRWVQEQTKRTSDVVQDFKVDTGPEWVAEELQVRVRGQKYWLFNVMDSDTRFILAAYLPPEHTTQAAATVLAMARERSANPPQRVKTDGLKSYQKGVRTAFPVHPVRHVVSQCIRAEINNNLSERLQGHVPRPGQDRCGRSKSERVASRIRTDWCSITTTSGHTADWTTNDRPKPPELPYRSRRGATLQGCIRPACLYAGRF